VWKYLFQATWKVYKSRFEDLIICISRYRHLIVSQANLVGIETSLEERKLRDRQFREMAEAETNRKLREVHMWLGTSRFEHYQFEVSTRLRTEYPGTGRWLLAKPKFKEWFEPLCQSIPPVLWLNGMPGAG